MYSNILGCSTPCSKIYFDSISISRAEQWYKMSKGLMEAFHVEAIGKILPHQDISESVISISPTGMRPISLIRNPNTLFPFFTLSSCALINLKEKTKHTSKSSRLYITTPWQNAAGIFMSWTNFSKLTCVGVKMYSDDCWMCFIVLLTIHQMCNNVATNKQVFDKMLTGCADASGHVYS